MATKRRTMVFVVIALGIFAFLLFLCLSLFIVLLFSFSPKRTGSSIVPKTYQYQEVRPSANYKDYKNRVSYGIAKMKRNLAKDEYLLYRNEETNRDIIISNFGGSEFECRGTCLCQSSHTDGPPSRRGTGPLHALSQTLTLVVSSVSLLVALQIAKESFEQTCVQMHHDTCDPDDIRSDAESCSYYTDKTDSEYDLENESHQFFCSGHCLPRNEPCVFSDLDGQVLYYDIDRIVPEENIPDCEKFEYSDSLIVGDDDASLVELKGFSLSNLDELTRYAKLKFAVEKLDQFCQKTSFIPPEKCLKHDNVYVVNAIACSAGIGGDAYSFYDFYEDPEFDEVMENIECVYRGEWKE